MPAAFAAVSEPMIVENDSGGPYVWVPDTAAEGSCNPTHENCGVAAFPFSCATDSVIGFEYEVRAPNGDDNTLGLQINDGSIFSWNVPEVTQIVSFPYQNGLFD